MYEQNANYRCKVSPSCMGLVVVLILATLLRLLWLDHGLGSHPDERGIVMRTMEMSWSNLNPGAFFYGSLLYYILWFAGQAGGLFSEWLKSYDGFFYLGRGIAALFGVVTIWLTYALTNALYPAERERSRGWLGVGAAAFLAFCVFHLQLSRFYTSDIILTCFATAVLLVLVRAGKYTAPLLGGFLIGAALATKVGALTLLLPFGILGVERCWRRPREIWIWGIGALLVPLAFFALAPYSFLSWERFYADTMEQIRMVRGEWIAPYTVQYLQTAPYLYPLEQILYYTIGVPVGLLAISGLVARGGAAIRTRSWNEGAVLLWALVTFLMIADKQVKFPRYLLPIYPILMLVAARWLFTITAALTKRAQLQLRWFSLALAGLVGWSLLTALAFVRIYSVPHSYNQSSSWVHENIPDGARILGVHWDDKIPVSIPGYDARRYQMFEPDNDLKIYEADTEQKLQEMAQQLASHDYLIFPTPRIPGSVPRRPDTLGQSTKLLQLLYSEQLGYRLIKTFKVRPTVGPLKFNDDLADESFSVYDHPKVTIFQNVERLPAELIADRVRFPALAEDRLPTLKEILLRDADGSSSGNYSANGSTVASRPSSLLALLRWLLCLELLALAVSPLLSFATSRSAVIGFAAAKSGGLLLFTILTWLLYSYLGVQTTVSTLWLIVVALAFISTMVVNSFYGGWRRYLAGVWSELRTVQLLFWGTLAVCAVFRSFHPEITWGEKTMDLSFFNYFARNLSYPPQDPWAAGYALRYYYFGFFAFSLLTKLSGIDTAQAYNLALPTIAACSAIGLYALMRSFSLSRRWSVAACLLVPFLANFEIVRLGWFEPFSEWDFDLFWASTRLFNSNGFMEYPIWGILFADLHPHVMTVPWTILLILLGFHFVQRAYPLSPGVVLNRVLLALVFSSLFLSNSWDFVSYSIVIGLFFLLSFQRARFARAAVWWRLILRGLAEAFFIGVVVLIVTRPLRAYVNPEQAFHFGWNHAEEHNFLGQYIRHYLFWYLSALALGLAGLFLELKSRSELLRAVLFAMVAFLLPVSVGLVGVMGGRVMPWGTLLFWGAILAVVFAYFGVKQASLRVQFAAALWLAATLLSLYADLAFLIDRMNTLFKFHMAVWSLQGVAVLALGAEVYQAFLSARRQREVGRVRWAYLPVGMVVPVFCAVLLGSLLAIGIMVRHVRMPSPKPTLDGIAFLKLHDRDLHRFVTQRSGLIIGEPTMLEAHGPEYQEYTRVTKYTGIPTYLGWNHHTGQRGVPYEERERRKEIIREVYSSVDADRAAQLLAEEGISFIAVGRQERELYGVGIDKFSSRPDLFIALFEGEQFSFYALSRAIPRASEISIQRGAVR